MFSFFCSSAAYDDPRKKFKELCGKGNIHTDRAEKLQGQIEEEKSEWREAKLAYKRALNLIENIPVHELTKNDFSNMLFCCLQIQGCFIRLKVCYEKNRSEVNQNRVHNQTSWSYQFGFNENFYKKLERKMLENMIEYEKKVECLARVAQKLGHEIKSLDYISYGDYSIVARGRQQFDDPQVPKHVIFIN